MYGIKGIVTDTNTGAPLKAEIFVLDHELDSSWVYTDMPLGNYHRQLFEGNYTIRFSSPGYFSKTFDVNINNEQTVNLDVQLKLQIAGITDHEEDALKIFPNPVTSTFLQVTSDHNMKYITIYSTGGNIVYKNEGDPGKRCFINTANFTNGTYIIVIDTGIKMYSRKIEILH